MKWCATNEVMDDEKISLPVCGYFATPDIGRIRERLTVERCISTHTVYASHGTDKESEA